jgi:hypothetical protein
MNAVKDSVDRIGGFLIRAILYDRALNQGRIDAYTEYLKANSKDPSNNNSSYYRNSSNSKLSSNDVSDANSIINEAKENVDFINNNLLGATFTDSVSLLKHNSDTVLASGQATLTAEQNDVNNNNRILSYRLNSKLNKDLTITPVEQFVRRFAGYQIDSWETNKFRYPASGSAQQYALDHIVGTTEVNLLKSEAEKRKTNILADMQNAGFNTTVSVLHCGSAAGSWGSGYTIGVGAHANPSSGKRHVYADVLSTSTNFNKYFGGNSSMTTVASFWVINYYGNKSSYTAWSHGGGGCESTYYLDPMTISYK